MSSTMTMTAPTTTMTMTMDTLKPQVPQLPTRSSRRVTTLLAGLPHKLDAEEQTELSRAAPHEHDHYLSSEEDASSSADELSSEYSNDSDYDEDLSPLSTDQRTPVVEQVTARAVSVIFSGKPSIVNLPRRSTAPSSSASSSSLSIPMAPPSRPSSCSTEASAPIHPSFAKRMSIMSFRSANTHLHNGSGAHLASYSRPNSVMLVDVGEHRTTPRRPNFLDSDPFPSPSMEAPASPRHHTKTPGTMLKKTFNLVKRRSSRARLGQLDSPLRDDMSLPDEHDETRTTSAASSISSPSKLRSVRGGLSSMGRPKSIRY